MSGKTWVLKGVDPEQRQRVREEAARAGLTIGEYLSRALHHSVNQVTGEAEGIETETESAEGGGFATETPATLRRIDTMEFRLNSAIAGLEDALRSIDHSMFSLSDRFDDTENLTHDTAQAVAAALGEFSDSVEQLRAGVDKNTQDAHQLHHRQSAQEQKSASLQGQIEHAHEIAANAESAAAMLKLAQDELSAKLEADIADIAETTRTEVESGLTDARASAEAAARAVDAALAEALETMRAQREMLEHRIYDVETNIAAHAEQTEIRIDTFGRDLGAAFTARADDTDRHVAALAHELSANIDATETLQNHGAELSAAQSRLAQGLTETNDRVDTVSRDLSSKIERVETSAVAALQQESSDIRGVQARLASQVAESRQSALLAGEELRASIETEIATLREEQLGASARIALLDKALGGVKAFPESADGQAPTPINARLEQLEAGIALNAGAAQTLEQAVARLGQELNDLAIRPVANLDETILARFDGLSARLRMQENVAEKSTHRAHELEQSLERIGEKIADIAARSSASIQSVEQSVEELKRHSTGGAVLADVEALSERLNQRMQALEASTVSLLEQQRAAFANWMDETRSTFTGAGISETVTALDQRIGGLEAQQAEIVNSLTAEISRFAALLDERMQPAEEGGANASAVTRDEFATLQASFDSRFDDFERRDSESAARLDETISATRKRMDERFGQIEHRSVEAIEKIAESVAALGKRLTQRQEEFVLDLVERVEAADPRLAQQLTQRR